MLTPSFTPSDLEYADVDICEKRESELDLLVRSDSELVKKPFNREAAPQNNEIQYV